MNLRDGNADVRRPDHRPAAGRERRVKLEGEATEITFDPNIIPIENV
jgi:hypothetical protein